MRSALNCKVEEPNDQKQGKHQFPKAYCKNNKTMFDLSM